MEGCVYMLVAHAYGTKRMAGVAGAACTCACGVYVAMAALARVGARLQLSERSATQRGTIAVPHHHHEHRHRPHGHGGGLRARSDGEGDIVPQLERRVLQAAHIVLAMLATALGEQVGGFDREVVRGAVAEHLRAARRTCARQGVVIACTRGGAPSAARAARNAGGRRAAGGARLGCGRLTILHWRPTTISTRSSCDMTMSAVRSSMREVPYQ